MPSSSNRFAILRSDSLTGPSPMRNLLASRMAAPPPLRISSSNAIISFHYSLLGFFQNRLLHIRWNLRVLQRLHDAAGSALAHAAQFRGVAEHLAQRDFRFDHADVTALLA